MAGRAKRERFAVLRQLIVLAPITTSSHTMWSVMKSRVVARIHLRIPLMLSCLIVELVNGV